MSERLPDCRLCDPEMPLCRPVCAPDVRRIAVHVSSLTEKLDENSAATQQVLDIVRSFKMLGSVAKWLGVLAGAGAAAVQLWRMIRGS
jgi:hypothetical protein